MVSLYRSLKLVTLSSFIAFAIGNCIMGFLYFYQQSDEVVIKYNGFMSKRHVQGMKNERTTEISIHTGRFSKELLEYLQSAKIFNLPETQLTINGFFGGSDYPFLTNHYAYEGYFHAYNHTNSITSMNPR